MITNEGLRLLFQNGQNLLKESQYADYCQIDTISQLPLGFWRGSDSNYVYPMNIYDFKSQKMYIEF